LVFSQASRHKIKKKEGIGWRLTKAHRQNEKKTREKMADLKLPFDCGSN
jgi:hypothetical protein